MMHREEMDEESWDTRETFAYFGRTFYLASTLEVGLAHALMFTEFLYSVKQEFIKDGGKSFDRARYEAEFDAYMEKQFAQTMGNIISKVEKLPEFSDELRARIVAAKKRRDFLTHHFWRDRAREFATANGRAAMRAELENDMNLFTELDRDVNAALQPARQRLGIKDQWLEEHMKKIMQEIKAGDN